MVRPRFDPAMTFVAARAFPYRGRPMRAGDPFPTEGIEPHRLRTLYGSRLINADPDGAARAQREPDDEVTVEPQPGGWYVVEAPWLEEPARIKGKVLANRHADKLRRDGEPAYHHGVEVTEGQNGWFDVKADWAEEPEKLRGGEAARERASELRREGPPPDPRTDVTIEQLGDAEFIINAPWLEEAEIAETRYDADQTAARLREAGPPAGWKPVDEPA